VQEKFNAVLGAFYIMFTLTFFHVIL